MSVGKLLESEWIKQDRPQRFMVSGLITIKTVTKSEYACDPTFSIEIRGNTKNIVVKLECFSLNFWVVLGSFTWRGIGRSLNYELRKRGLYYENQ